MPPNHETTRVRNLPDSDLFEYIDMNGTKSPEREHALHVLNDRHQRKNQERLSELIKVIEGASSSSDKLGRKLYVLNWILVFATVVGAAATVVMAWQAWYQQSSIPAQINTDQ